MRDLILDAIENIRDTEGGFTHNTMRWSYWYLIPKVGHACFRSRKEKSRANVQAIRLDETTRSDFESLENKPLLACYNALIRQASKQM